MSLDKTGSALTVAVTGASGFIGRNLTTRLVERGVVVRAIVRAGSPRAAAPGAIAVTAPLERQALTNAFDGCDVVVHLAGVVSTSRPRDFEDVNVEGTRAVAEAARTVQARLIHVSSLAAAGPAPRSHPRGEDDAETPLTPYGRSKLASEQVVRSIDRLAWTILRPGVVYGPGDRAMLPLFQFARRGMLPLVGRRDAAYTFIHIADAVRAIEAAIDRPPDGSVIFLGYPTPVTARELLDTIRTAVNPRAVVVPIPGGVVHAAAFAGEWAGRAIGRSLLLNHARHQELVAEGFVCRVDRLRERLGVVAEVGLREGTTALADWYRAAGWL